MFFKWEVIMSSKVLQFSLFLALFIQVFSVCTGNFDKMPCKAMSTLTSQKDLDLNFLMAVYRDDIKEADCWLNSGANVNAIQKYTYKELSKFDNLSGIAIPGNYLALNLGKQNISALSLAKSSYMIKFLISRGVNLNYEITQDISDSKTMQVPILKSVIYNAIQYDLPEMVLNMLNAGANANKVYDAGILEQLEKDLHLLKTKEFTKHGFRFGNLTKEERIRIDTIEKIIQAISDNIRKVHKEKFEEIFPKALAIIASGYSV